ncbi:hypothetical protein BKP35_14745 [Anaerobacillus arseniciselenatis]|uniref:Small peptidoglycan-associated lipoprotein n=2 Tax=Anaerobacillus arseniciselenatis TaxID=85682 RepID=A0A1S2LDD6_9BACI|nr:hypothetical protein BKP35_14745 [Anaerobacillus arseniciselenatis]
MLCQKTITTSFSYIFLLMFLSSCNNNEVLSNYPFLQKEDEHITILFSDDHYIHEEGNYYDALLDVKRRYPELIRSFNIIHSSDRDLIRYFEISEFPTLLVIHNEKITIRVEGSLQKNEILQTLEQSLIK